MGRRLDMTLRIRSAYYLRVMTEAMLYIEASEILLRSFFPLSLKFNSKLCTSVRTIYVACSHFKKTWVQASEIAGVSFFVVFLVYEEITRWYRTSEDWTACQLPIPTRVLTKSDAILRLSGSSSLPEGLYLIETCDLSKAKSESIVYSTSFERYGLY